LYSSGGGKRQKKRGKVVQGYYVTGSDGTRYQVSQKEYNKLKGYQKSNPSQTGTGVPRKETGLVPYGSNQVA
jgi:hypothetical protein